MKLVTAFLASCTVGARQAGIICLVVGLVLLLIFGIVMWRKRH